MLSVTSFQTKFPASIQKTKALQPFLDTRWGLPNLLKTNPTLGLLHIIVKNFTIASLFINFFYNTCFRPAMPRPSGQAQPYFPCLFQWLTFNSPLTRGKPSVTTRPINLQEDIVMATEVTVPMVGKIVSVEVNPGDAISENDPVVILEAMKMEMPVPAPASGTIKEILVKAGDEVEAEKVIALIE